MAGGVNLTLLAETPAMFQKAGMLSPEGRCKTLDAAADGYVRAEACGLLTLATWHADAATPSTDRSASRVQLVRHLQRDYIN